MACVILKVFILLISVIQYINHIPSKGDIPVRWSGHLDDTIMTDAYNY